MYLGLLTVHPVAIPLGNELLHFIMSALTQTTWVYTGVIKPEIKELMEVISII